MSRWKSDAILLFVAAIWGSGFVAQRLAAAVLNPNYFNSGRYLLGALLLLPLTRLRWNVEKRLLPWIILAGVILFGASWCQQTGLATTTIGNASFITGLYVVLVPIILFFVLKKKLHWLSWGAAMLAAVGVGLLSLQGEIKLAPGDTYELVGAVLWALHIILIGWVVAQGVDVLWFSIIQFATCGAISLALGLALDPQGLGNISLSWQAIVYSAFVPTAMGYTLQVAGQKGAPPVDAAIILSMEAVFGTLLGFLFMNELLSLRQLSGCFLILVAMILAQIKQEPAIPEKMEQNLST